MPISSQRAHAHAVHPTAAFPAWLQVQAHGTRWAQVYDAYVRKGRIGQQRTQVGRQVAN